MKTVNNLLIILLFALQMTSCEDFLVQEPSSSLPASESVKTVNDLQNAVNGAYAGLNNSGYYSGDFFPLGDLRGDDMTYIRNFGQISPIARYEYQRNSSYAENFWAVPYITIGRVNNILNVADDITVEPGDETRFKDLVGQLFALRAICHFDLARVFAQLPTALYGGMTMDTPEGGIPISDQVYPVDYKPKRNTLSETYDFLLADFDRALLRLDPSKFDSTSYGNLNIWSTKALKARVQLYLGNYLEAFNLAVEVIDNNAGYRLAEVTEYYGMWDSLISPEFLFSVATTPLYNAQRNSLGYYSSPDGYGEFAFTNDFATWLLASGNDVRKYMLVRRPPYGYFPTKYRGREGNLYVNDPKVIRMGEVYLIAAEAAFRIDNGSPTSSLALEYLNRLRQKRLVSGYIPLVTVTIDDILNERRKELLAEGHRCWDVWRNKLPLTNTDFSAAPVNYNNFRTLVAIPQRETDISPDLKQNPGWD